MIHREQDGTKLISRRALLLGGGQAALLTALVGRMYYLQVLESSKYQMLADQNRINIRLLPPPRGRILDRNGTPLAVNRQNYRVLVVAEQTDDIGDTLDALGTISPVSDHDRARIIRETARRPSFASVLVRENLSWEEMSRIEINAPDLPGVMIDVGQTRNYPLQELGAHFLGYVSAVSENDLQNSNDPLLELPGFRIGKAGIEKVYDLALRGKGGTSQVEVNAVGRVIRELSRDEGQPGADLKLTIDVDLQRYTMERLGAESAAAVMMDVHTGEVLVLASTPQLRPERLQSRADRRRVERPDHQSTLALDQQGDRRRLRAGFNLQDDDRIGRARKRVDHPGHEGVLSRTMEYRQRHAALLEAWRARLGRFERRPEEVL